MPISSLWSGNAHLETYSGFPTVVENALTEKQLQAYIAMVRIGEIEDAISNRRYVQWAERESPLPHAQSEPAPVYDARGHRTNTKDVLLKKALEFERNSLIKFALEVIPQYKPPINYNPNVKITEKLFLNASAHPEINFMGLLLGPRGNTLKKLQGDSGARIGLRGKGSVKGGRAVLGNNLDEELHCVITAESQEKVDLAKRLCLKVIDEVIHAPVGQNEHKRNQLKELAIINGTYRETVAVCQICGETGHRKFQCPNSQLANNFKCTKCGQIGHLESDCQSQAEGGDGMDDEFDEFMKELGEEPTESQPQEHEQGHAPVPDEEPQQQKRQYEDQGYNNYQQQQYQPQYQQQQYQQQQPYPPYKRHNNGYRDRDRGGGDYNNYNQYGYNNGYNEGGYQNDGYQNGDSNGGGYYNNYNYGRYNNGYQGRDNRGGQFGRYQNNGGSSASPPLAQVKQQAYGFSTSPFAQKQPSSPAPQVPATAHHPPPPPPPSTSTTTTIPPPPPPAAGKMKSTLPPPPPGRKLPPPPPPPAKK